MLLRVATVSLFALMGSGVIPALAQDPEISAATHFQRTCAMCHGQDGKATTPMARRMAVKDLTVSTLSEDQVRQVIENGVKTPKGAMPAYRGKFSEAELAALVAYVHSLRGAEKPANP